MEREADGKFAARLSDARLLAAVRELAEQALPTDPRLCSQRQFDDAGARLHPRLPSAISITQRFRCSWPALLEVIFDPDRDEHHFLSLRARYVAARGMTLEDAVEAVRYTASVRGSNGVLSAAEHDAVMVPLGEAAKRRHSGRIEADWLYPTAQLIATTVGWEPALTAAGLLRPEGGHNSGVPVIEALEMFLEAHGYLVSRRPLRAWTDKCGFALSTGSVREAREELIRRRRERGLWTPSQTLPPDKWPPAPEDDGPRLDTGEGKRLPRRLNSWNEAKVRDGLRVAAERARSERIRLTQRALKRFAKEDRRIPTWTALDTYARRAGTTGGEWLKQAAGEV